MTVIVPTMNDRIKTAVRVELARRGMTQKELAERIGMAPSQLSATMIGRDNKLPPTWQRIFDELDLELAAIPKRDFKRIAPELGLDSDDEG